MQKACVFFIFGMDMFSKLATKLSCCNGDKHSFRKFVLQVATKVFSKKMRPEIVCEQTALHGKSLPLANVVYR
jgi:hypothetical protein